jgi:uncharacterized protein with FMN-binding domain
MRRIVLFLASTAAALALLFSYRTSWGDSLAGSATVATAGAGPVGVVPGATGSSANGSSANDTVVNGSVARTRWGPVQVRVTIAQGRITDVSAIQYPTGNSRDQQINASALPRLRSQVLAAQSAGIDGVSGATVTSDGYILSLQAALDTAHFG